MFQNGVYTACEPCAEDPTRPPMWQVKAARIIHDQSEKMVYYEDARLEMLGVPLAYIPFFSAPDPTVKRKTGFLMPVATYSSVYGFGVTTPFYWALAPNYDVTITPTMTSLQGPLLQVEWRHRLMSGAYAVRGAGIWQLDKSQFAFQGPRTTSIPAFAISAACCRPKASSPWRTDGSGAGTGTVVTDRPFLQDYSVARVPQEFISQLYLTGVGDRSYFDVRAMHYLGMSGSDRQEELPIIHPVLDYSNVLGQPIFGGELSYRLQPDEPEPPGGRFRSGQPQTAFDLGLCNPTTADPAVVKNPGQLPAARHPGQLLTALRRRAVAAQDRRSPGPGLAAFRVGAGRRGRAFRHPGGRGRELHPDRREHAHPRHAGRRPRVSLSLHQRAFLGHADDRADRPGDRAAGRDRNRPASPTRTHRA